LAVFRCALTNRVFLRRMAAFFSGDVHAAGNKAGRIKRVTWLGVTIVARHRRLETKTPLRI
jgi:hypothetical protein